MLTRLDLNDEEIKMLVEILNFSIAACPLGGISQDIEIDEDKIEKLISKIQKVSAA